MTIVADEGLVVADRVMTGKRAVTGRSELVFVSQGAANLVKFLLSDDGGWTNAQLLRSDGGFSQLAQS